MLKAVLSPPNAILFILDPTNKDAVIPPYVDSELTASSSTCVSVGTRADVDGDINVALDVGGIAPVGLKEVFRGAIEVPGGKVAVVTSHYQCVLQVDVPAGPLGVTIWTDDIHNPSQVAVNVQPSVLA